MFPLYETARRIGTPKVTLALIAANLWVFGYELLLSDWGLGVLFHSYGLVPGFLTVPEYFLPAWESPPYHSFVTNLFLHGGWLHIVSNMWSLWLFGDNVEDRLGGARFLLFYVACGVAANVVQLLTDPTSTVPVVGASGAVAGVMGAYLVMFPHSRVIALLPVLFLPFTVAIPAVLYLVFWFITQLFSGTLSLLAPNDAGGIAFWAHVGGFMAGVMLAPRLVRPSRGVRFYEYG